MSWLGRFAALDHLSGGRAGWNIVTTVTPLAAANFGENAAIPITPTGMRVRTSSSRWPPGLVGQLGRQRGRAASTIGGVWADRSKLRAPRFHRRVLRRRGGPAVSALAAGAARDGPGRAVGGRDRPGRPVRRAGVLRAAVAGGGGRVPRRAARPGRRRGPGPRARAGPARPDGDPGRHRGRGAARAQRLEDLASPEFAGRTFCTPPGSTRTGSIRTPRCPRSWGGRRRDPAAQLFAAARARPGRAAA